MLCGIWPWKTRVGSHSSVAWYVVLWFKTAKGRNLCQLFLNSPVDALRCALTDACVRSNSPIVWACFVVACLSSMFRTAATSSVTWEVNCVPISVMIVVGRYVCLHKISMITFATAGAVILVTG